MTSALHPLSLQEQNEAMTLQIALDRIELPRRLAPFVRESWPIIEPSTAYLHNWHIDATCEYLEAVKAAEITRLIINMPPRYMKSLMSTIMFPAWWWTEIPEERFVFASYGDALGKEHSLKRRDIIQSGWYQDRWGDRVCLADDQNEKREFKNTASGVMVSVPVGGSITGKGGNCIIVDDPINPEDASSVIERVRAIRFIEQTLSTRLNDKKRGRIVIIMQRLHENDPTGHELKKGGWEHLKLPAEAPKRALIVTPRGSRFQREEGDILWPEREGKKELAIAKLALTEVAYAGQYQQEPVPLEGAMIKREWWKTYRQADLPESFEFVLDSWDCTFKDTDGSDFVVGTKWGKRGNRIYLLALKRQRMGFSETCLAVQGLQQTLPTPFEILIEDKANGTAVIETMRKIILSGIEAVEPMGGKESRTAAVSPTIRNGLVFVPHPEECPWVTAFIEECAMFPNGEHDDQVDSMSQAILRFILRGGGMYAWMQEKIREDEQQKKAVAVEDANKAETISQAWSKSIEMIARGGSIQVGRDQYDNGLRMELQRYAATCADQKDTARMQIALNEIERLDALFKRNKIVVAE